MIISNQPTAQLDDLLLEVSRQLDIPPSKYELAVERYHTIADFLTNCPILGQLNPDIYVQGSMALGTMVAPVTGQEYDVDMTATFDFAPLTSEASRKHVLNRFFGSDRYRDKIDNSKRRCIRLVYKDEFHIDVIPAKPDSQPDRLFGDVAVSIPDKDLKDWFTTNPRGYVEWFLTKAHQHKLSGGMTKIAAASEILKEARAVTQPAPKQAPWGQKYPLQILVQILKRHRDLAYGGDCDAPISVIITTLAAMAITPEPSLIQTLRRLPGDMRNVLQSGRLNSEWRVLNPTNIDENFADKWNDPEIGEARSKAFFAWTHELDANLEELVKSFGSGLKTVEEGLKKIAGANIASETLDQYRKKIGEARLAGTLGVGATGGLSIAARTHAAPVPKNTFFGT